MTLRRVSAGLLALAVLATLTTRIALNMETHGLGLTEALWRLFRYFTIWTNTAIALAAGLIAGRGRLDGRISGGLVLAIVAVGLVYHALLAHLNAYTGLDQVIDVMLHTVVPMWFVLHWLAFEPKERVGFAALPGWLGFPAVYCLYALIRAQVDGRYPYFFLDIAKHGLAQVGLNIAGLIAGFAVLGAAIVLLARLLSGRQLAHQG
ncbi:Pr6Pr family membrane protein [Marinovum sp.]|uniref:Pr6Pr family membrane protein n=1 Tax=Marinovum sp. TaxID=2024839 RepID=UPI002B26491D|nr:Pr6Pr family membrane protein [Marinovum sp.]